MSYKELKKHRRLRKKQLIDCLGGKCARCGYNVCDGAIDFHHINPEEKEFTIGSTLNKSLDSIINEAKKCVLLCSNCHREFHNGLWELSSIKIPKFVDKITKIYIKDTPAFCLICGEQFYRRVSKHKLCSDKCRRLYSRKVKRPSKQELEKMVWEMPSEKIGEKFNVSGRCVGKWCKAMSIQKPPRGYWTGK